jgi:predicted ferric reductase
MKLRSFKLGQICIALVVILTIGIWFFVRSGTNTFSDYSTATHSLGQITGLIGMILFSLTFFLTTRLKFIENIFGGLDKVYHTHKRIGAIAFVLILFHPILLVIKFIPSNVKQAALYLLPSKSWPVNFGIIALVLMIFLIVLTLYIGMKYQNWKLSHKFMGIIFIIAGLHVFRVTTDITKYPLLKIYMLVLCILGLIAYIYGSFIRPTINQKTYFVESVKTKENVTQIKLIPKDKSLEFKPGQFVFIKFKDKTITNEQHPFTIASSPSNRVLTIMAKDLGDFTSSLKNLKPKTVAKIEGPYGNFSYSDYKDLTQVWIAGGIGITPFLSMIQNIKNIEKPIDFYYCTKNKKEAIFLDKLIEVSPKLKGLKIIPHFSDEEGFITIDKIKKISSPLNEKIFLICGPPKMMFDISRQLKNNGVSKEKIIMEDFGFK